MKTFKLLLGHCRLWQAHICLTVAATASHRSVEDVKELHKCFQAAVSNPEAPAALSVWRTVLRMGSPSSPLKRVEWGSVWYLGMLDCFLCYFGGCFFFGTSLIVPGLEELQGLIWLSRLKWPIAVAVSYTPRPCMEYI